MSGFLTRFAPSPTGRLHLGHALSAFAVWDAAAKAGGHVLLRIEDIDLTRCRPEYETGIYEDLVWLGLAWKGEVRRQSEHFAGYQSVLDQLLKLGLIYRCFRSRREIVTGLPAVADSSDAAYVSKVLPALHDAERFERRASFAWRLSLSAALDHLGTRPNNLAYFEQIGGAVREVPADPAGFGDVVLARKDTPASYHLACCHDDARQGITHIVRGEDLRDATTVHTLLQALMGWPQPVYTFHPLLLGADGKKLSKRNASKSLAEYRAEGMTPADIRAMTRAHD